MFQKVEFSRPLWRRKFFRKRSKFTDSQIHSILKQAENGTPISVLCREQSMSAVTFYKWRAKYDGMDASMMSRLKELEAEILKEAIEKKGNTVTPKRIGEDGGDP